MPLYENEVTLARENEAKSKLERESGLVFRKLPIQYSLDFAVTEKDSTKILYFLELKCRHFAHDKYAEYVLSFDKIIHTVELNKITGLPCYLALGFSDGVILKTRLDDVENWSPVWGGRTVKTRRDADIHPVVHLPQSWFERVV